MSLLFSMKTFIPLIIFTLITLGCATTRVIRIQTVSGTYSGVTGDGSPITLTLEQKDQAFSGQGTISGKPLVISGIMTWEAIGSVTYSDGSSSLVRASLSADSNTLTIETLGQPNIVLNRGGTPVAQPSGPFSGRYRSVGPDASLANATIVQTGSLITGVAEIFDQNAGITGRVTAPNKAVGIITFLNESQASFNAELSTDGRSITVFGLGNPIVFERF